MKYNNNKKENKNKNKSKNKNKNKITRERLLAGPKISRSSFFPSH